MLRQLLLTAAASLLIIPAVASAQPAEAGEPGQPHTDLLTDFAHDGNDAREYRNADDEPLDLSLSSWGADPFAEGNKFWAVRLAASRDSTLGEIYHAQVAAGKYYEDNLAFYLALSLGYADAQKAEDGIYGGPHVGLRWHFVNRDPWSLYLDASVGTVFHQHPITEESLHFNFDVQAGVGATWRIKRDMLLDAGVRWHHLSNARVKGKDQNLGYDGPMGYIGVVIPF